MTEVFIALVALNILDGWLTLKILSDGGRELNPLMKTLMDEVGPVAAMSATKLVMLAIVWWVGDEQVTALLALVYTGLCVWNFRQLSN